MRAFYVVATFKDSKETTPVHIQSNGKIFYCRNHNEALQLRRHEDAVRFKKAIQDANLEKFEGMTGQFDIHELNDS